MKNLYFNGLKKEYRYVGYNVESGPMGNLMYCFGFWWFHIYYESNNFVKD